MRVVRHCGRGVVDVGSRGIRSRGRPARRRTAPGCAAEPPCRHARSRRRLRAPVDARSRSDRSSDRAADQTRRAGDADRWRSLTAIRPGRPDRPCPERSAAPARRPGSRQPAPPQRPRPATAAAEHAIPACDKPDALGLVAHRRNRHHGRPRIRHRALQAIRLPARPGSRADLRRRPVAGKHADGAQGAAPTIAPRRRSSRSASTRPGIPTISKMVAAAGMTIGSHTWSHKDLAKNPYAKDIEQAKDEIEMGVSAVHMARRRPDRAVLPLSRSAAAARTDDLSRHAQHRDLLDRHRHLRLQDAQARGRDQIGDDQARQERQGHCADARFPARRRPKRCRNCCASSRPAATRSCTWCRRSR